MSLFLNNALAQKFVPNYDEERASRAVIPGILQTISGKPVQDSSGWLTYRKPELTALFMHLMYGRVTGQPDTVLYDIVEKNGAAFGGKAIRRQVDIWFTRKKTGPVLHLLIYLPVRPIPAPVFLGLNFDGNHTVSDDPMVPVATSWVENDAANGITGNRASEASRGKSSTRWCVEKVLEHGYGLATVYYGDIDPDFDDGFRNGVHGLFRKPGDTYPSDAWGSIAAWAWGLSRCMDYLMTDSGVDKSHIIVIGHSRLGKAALWAAAQDSRFFMAVSNNSGCGGAALSKRAFGETVQAINDRFPHWFCGNFKLYNQREEFLPFDQHMLLALIAPRPVYVASTTQDLWADPKGEFLSAFLATPVYRLFGKEGLPVSEMPPPDSPVMGTIGYHIRTGKHDITPFDWEQYLKFAGMHIRKARMP